MTGSAVIELDDVRRAGAELLDEFGRDHVYERVGGTACLYEYRGEPSCFVGRIMHRLGVPVDVLAEWDHDPIDLTDGAVLPGVALDDLARAWLAAAQTWQDRGESWGAAYAAGDDALTAATAGA